MKELKNVKPIKICVCVLLIVLTSQLFAAYKMKRYSINNNSSHYLSHRFKIKSSTAQVDANVINISENYQLSTGFWYQNTDLIFSNNFK